MNINELKPCPFCGGKAEFERVGTQRESCIVTCEDCGGRHESGDTWDSGSSWNRRPKEAKLEVEIERLRNICKSTN
jgi:Lar family restriction alleviation protein